MIVSYGCTFAHHIHSKPFYKIKKNYLLVFTENCTVNPTDLTYVFYNLKNPKVPILVPQKNPAAIKNTHFDKTKETIFLVHGSGGNNSGLLITATRDSIFGEQLDMNVIAVDWFQVQVHNRNLTNKTKRAIYDCAEGFGKNVGGFLNDMVKSNGLNPSKLTVVGHSIAGAFCRAIVPYVKGKIKAMVGLETAGIRPADAEYTEVKIYMVHL